MTWTWCSVPKFPNTKKKKKWNWILSSFTSESVNFTLSFNHFISSDLVDRVDPQSELLGFHDKEAKGWQGTSQGFLFSIQTKEKMCEDHKPTHSSHPQTRELPEKQEFMLTKKNSLWHLMSPKCQGWYWLWPSQCSGRQATTCYHLRGPWICSLEDRWEIDKMRILISNCNQPLCLFIPWSIIPISLQFGAFSCGECCPASLSDKSWWAVIPDAASNLQWSMGRSV